MNESPDYRPGTLDKYEARDLLQRYFSAHDLPALHRLVEDIFTIIESTEDDLNEELAIMEDRVYELEAEVADLQAEVSDLLVDLAVSAYALRA